MLKDVTTDYFSVPSLPLFPLTKKSHRYLNQYSQFEILEYKLGWCPQCWIYITSHDSTTLHSLSGPVRKFSILAYYAWPRTPSTKVTRKERNPWRQHVHRATRPRSYAIEKCERQWRHVALATAGPMLVANNMAAYPLGISSSVCPLRISSTCLMSVHHVKSIICYLCFMQHAWSC